MTSCFPSSRGGPTTSARLSFAGAGALLTSARGERDELVAARAPPRGRSARGRSRSSAAAASPREASPTSSSEFGSVLRRCANAASTTRLIAREVLGHLDAPERDERGVDVRPRPEHVPRDRVEARALGRELEEHRDGAVRLRPGRGEEAVGDLALHHHAPVLDASVARRGSRRRAASRRCTAGSRRACAAAARARARSRRARRRSSRSTLRRSPSASRSVRLEAAVELDRVDRRDAVGEVAREDAEPGPDLEHDVARLELGEPADHAEDVLVDEKVLAELLLRRDVHGRPKARAAFASICAAELVGVLAAASRERRDACGRRSRARSAGRGAAAARGTGSRSRRGSGRRAPATRRRGARPRSCR